MKRLLALIAALSILLSGCATSSYQRMPFVADSERPEEKKKPVFLMTATLKNVYRPTFQPRLWWVNVDRADGATNADRLSFQVDDKARNETDSPDTGNNYLLRFELDPGKYEVRSLYGRPLYIGEFLAPMHSPLDVKEPGIFYLGHVNATLREKQGNEFRAGVPLPLVAQALIGATGGTFDIEITDKWSSDEAAFLSRFPALKGATIQKAILPAFDRAKAQKKWEDKSDIGSTR